MVDIVVREGEYEYLIETDPRFREFVKACEGKSISDIWSELVTRNEIIAE